MLHVTIAVKTWNSSIVTAKSIALVAMRSPSTCIIETKDLNNIILVANIIIVVSALDRCYDDKTQTVQLSHQ